MVAGAAGRGGLYEGRIFLCFGCLRLFEINLGALAGLADVDLRDIVDGLDDMFRQEPAEDELCEMLRETDQLHGKLVIEIDIDQMLIEDLFFFGKDLTFPADELIGLCLQ